MQGPFWLLLASPIFFQHCFYYSFTLYYCAIFTSLNDGFFQYHQGVKQFGSRSGPKLEDLMVLRSSPDLLNNVKIGQGQLQLIMEQILFLPYTFSSSDLNNLMNNPSNSQVISEKKMFR